MSRAEGSAEGVLCASAEDWLQVERIELVRVNVVINDDF